MQEFALGLEGIERFVQGESVARVHEMRNVPSGIRERCGEIHGYKKDVPSSFDERGHPFV